VGSARDSGGGRQGEQPEQVFVDFVYQPVPHGPAAGVLIFAADVTVRVRDRARHERLAAQLAITQERYRTLFDTLPQGVIYHAADGQIIEANQAAGEILGVDPAAMVSWPVAASAALMREDGSLLQPEDFPVMTALRTGAVVADVMVGTPHGRTGELRWLRVTAVPDARDEDGRPQRAYAMFRDMTEQRRAEATLREGAELMGRLRTANVLGVVVAGEERVYDANDAFLDIIGYSREDLAAGYISYRGVTAPEWAASDADGAGAGRAGRGRERRGAACFHADGRGPGHRHAGPARPPGACRPAGRAQHGRLLHGVPAGPERGVASHVDRPS
jgi:PAS domain S-box-containing protein